MVGSTLMGEKKRPSAPAPMKPMAVRIPAELRQRLRVYVAKADVKIQGVITDAIEDYLKKHGG